jgi:hypothetical protein
VAESGTLQAFTQQHAGAVEDHPAVGSGDPQTFSDLVGSEPVDLAIGEDFGASFGQIPQAVVEGIQKRLHFVCLARIIAPVRRGRLPLAVGLEHPVHGLLVGGEELTAASDLLLAVVVDELVFEDGEKPGLLRRLSFRARAKIISTF